MKTRSIKFREAGSVLVIVLWVAFGLASIALYFGQSMGYELRAADNRVAAIEAEKAADGAMRYAAYLMANAEEKGKLPDVLTYQREAVRVGESYFWFIGRGNEQTGQTDPIFGLGDEASKLNLNTATRAMLEALPRMTPELAAAIVDWRDEDSEVTSGGAEEDTYMRLRPSYRCKNGPFESVEELRLVFGMDLEILYGEDANRNGILDPNENDGDVSPPTDNRDGRLDPGLIEYLTVWSSESNAGKINVSTQQGRQQLASVLQQAFGNQRANQILAAVGGGTVQSVLEFYLRSRMTAEEFAQIAGQITATNGAVSIGLVNVNTASAAVLACLPGLDSDKAAALVSYREANPSNLNSIAWVAEVLDAQAAAQAGRFLTATTSQLAVDVGAVGRFGRGYRRVRYVMDVSGETPRVLDRRDLTGLGWALGRNARQRLLFAENTR